MSLVDEFKRKILHIFNSKYYLDKTPYVIAIINLQEKVRIMSNIIEKNHNNIKIGKKVQVIFQKLNEEITLPCFKLI